MKVSTSLPRVCRRTVLRLLVEADLARFQAYRTDPAVARYQDWDQMTDEEAISFIRSTNVAEILIPGEWSQIGIADESAEHLIGDIGIHINTEETEAEIGFTLDSRYQKQGLARETVREAILLIFEQTRVDRVIGITDERNIASIKLLKALGMDHIETLDTVFRGEACTEMTFALSRESCDAPAP